MRRSFVSLRIAAASAVLLATACASHNNATSPQASASTAAAGKPIVVAAFDFSESQILANMFADVLDKAGLNASVRTMTTREAVQPALWSGDVQVVPEYTSSLTAFLNRYDNGSAATKKSSSDLAATMTALRQEASNHHIVVLEPSAAANQNAFAVTTQFADTHHLTKLSDLASYKGALVLGGPAECPSRPYCEPGLEQTYGIAFTGFRSLDPGGPLTKLALKAGQIQVGLVFTSDPGVAAYNLTVLADDRQLQDIDVVVPVVNRDVVTPALSAALNGVMAALTTSDLVQLNAAAQLQHVDPTTVAKQYLAAKGLL
jgi:osmoprotectant transport system substrate-binding protein